VWIVRTGWFSTTPSASFMPIRQSVCQVNRQVSSLTLSATLQPSPEGVEPARAKWSNRPLRPYLILLPSHGFKSGPVSSSDLKAESRTLFRPRPPKPRRVPIRMRTHLCTWRQQRRHPPKRWPSKIVPQRPRHLLARWCWLLHPMTAPRDRALKGTVSHPLSSVWRRKSAVRSKVRTMSLESSPSQRPIPVPVSTTARNRFGVSWCLDGSGHSQGRHGGDQGGLIEGRFSRPRLRVECQGGASFTSARAQGPQSRSGSLRTCAGNRQRAVLSGE